MELKTEFHRLYKKYIITASATYVDGFAFTEFMFAKYIRENIKSRAIAQPLHISVCNRYVMYRNYGRDLSYLIGMRKTNPTIACSVFSALISATCELEAHSILHLDLSTNNVCMRDGIPTIIDFDRMTILQTGIDAMGEWYKSIRVTTICAASPEVMDGIYSHKLTPWSLAVIAIQMSSGKLLQKLITMPNSYDIEKDPDGLFREKLRGLRSRIDEFNLLDSIKMAVYHMLDPDPETRMSVFHARHMIMGASVGASAGATAGASVGASTVPTYIPTYIFPRRHNYAIKDLDIPLSTIITDAVSISADEERAALIIHGRAVISKYLPKYVWYKSASALIMHAVYRLVQDGVNNRYHPVLNNTLNVVLHIARSLYDGRIDMRINMNMNYSDFVACFDKISLPVVICPEALRLCK